MQLELRPEPGAGSLRRGLIAASCALLGATAARAQEPTVADTDSGQGDWTLESALAYYHESNGRIQAIEPIVNLRKDDGSGNTLNIDFTYDSLSGSSPNGALTSNRPQTFASPSGTSLSAIPQTYTTASGQVVSSSAPIYTTAPGQLPADPNYRDQRIALGAGWQIPLDRLTLGSFGGKLSYEHDFLSLTANAGIARDFNQKNTTVSLGLNEEVDSIHPIGGAPVAGSDYALFEKTGSKSKNGTGVLAGVTQIMTRAWISEFNLSVDRFTGYLNDPYKIISVLDATGTTSGYLYEKRPDVRLRKSAFLENRVGFDRASVALALRYMSDDWGVHSETAQLRLRWWNTDRDRYLEPTARWYRQSAADFYTPWVDAGASYLSYASSDSRLGAFHALTYGLKYGAKLDDALDQPGSEFSVRVELYQQTVDERRAAPAALAGVDLYPGLRALLVQVSFSY